MSDNTEITAEVIVETEVKVDGRKNNPGRPVIVAEITPINQPVYDGYKVAAAQPAYITAVRELCEWCEGRGVYNLLYKDLAAFFVTFASAVGDDAKKIEKDNRKIDLVMTHTRYFYRWLLNNGYEEKIHRSILVWLAK